MTTTHTDPVGQVQFQLAVPPELAHELATLPDLTVSATDEAPDRVQYELALETIATILTIVVNADKLASTCTRIAHVVHKFFSDSRDHPPRLKVIGERDETVLEITLDKVAKTADNIRFIVSK